MAKAELIDERVSVGQCKLAIDALRAYALKNEQKQQDSELLPRKEPNIWLNVTVKKVPSGRTFKPIKIPIAHPLLDPHTTSICLITKDPQREYKDLIEAHDIKFISRVVGLKKLKGKFKPFEARRMLLKENGLFLADDRIIPLLPKLLGVKWFEAKKQPIPVSLKRKDLKAELERAVSSTYMNQNRGTCTSIKVATLSQPPTDILSNLKTALPAIAKHIYGGWDNVQALHIKTNSSVSLPIWSCNLDDEEAEQWTGLATDLDQGASMANLDEDTQMNIDVVDQQKSPANVRRKSVHKKSDMVVKSPSSVVTADQKRKVSLSSTSASKPSLDIVEAQGKVKRVAPIVKQNQLEKDKATSKTSLSRDELRHKRGNTPGEKKKSKVTSSGGKRAKDSVLGRKAAQE